MCAIDDEGKFIKKSSLFICARQSGKSHMLRMRVLAGLFCFDERNILIMSSQRRMAAMPRGRVRKATGMACCRCARTRKLLPSFPRPRTKWGR